MIQRFLFRTVFFLAFSVALLVIVLTLTPRPMPWSVIRNLNVPIGGYGHNYSRMEEVVDYGKVDVLVLGSSHAYRGLDPRIFAAHGYRTFNLGSSNQSIEQSTVLLHRHLDRTSPKVVLLIVGPTTFNTSVLEGTLDLLANAAVDSKAAELAASAKHVRAWNALIHATGKQIIFGPPHTEEAVRKGKDVYVSGGFVERDLEYYSAQGDEHHAPLVENERLRNLDTLLTALRSKQVKVALVRAPVTEHLRSTIEERSAFAQAMAERAYFIDAHDLVTLDDSLHFYDISHLNQRGVELFNAALIERLERDGIIQPRHSSPITSETSP